VRGHAPSPLARETRPPPTKPPYGGASAILYPAASAAPRSAPFSRRPRPLRPPPTPHTPPPAPPKLPKPTLPPSMQGLDHSPTTAGIARGSLGAIHPVSIRRRAPATCSPHGALGASTRVATSQNKDTTTSSSVPVQFEPLLAVAVWECVSLRHRGAVGPWAEARQPEMRVRTGSVFPARCVVSRGNVRPQGPHKRTDGAFDWRGEAPGLRHRPPDVDLAVEADRRLGVPSARPRISNKGHDVFPAEATVTTRPSACANEGRRGGKSELQRQDRHLLRGKPLLRWTHS